MKSYKVIGLMSGTSLDGLDIAYCLFQEEKGNWKYTIQNGATIPYSEEKKNILQNAFNETGVNLTYISHEFGRFMGEEVQKFIQKYSIDVDFVSSHGHTIFHQPDKGFTLQIGHGSSLSAGASLPVVCDFRTLDVALGGQGAPLVPIGDKLLFSEYEMCLNLGGIANISFDEGHKRIAFDICPVNMVLNWLANFKGAEFDNDGYWASKGTLNNNLLNKLNQLEFYNQPFPKSLGKEWVDKNIIPLIEDPNLSIEDKLSTFCVHIAHQIQKVVNEFLEKNKLPKAKILITGGGAFNSFLINQFKATFNSKVEIVVPDKNTIMFKEALIFGFLGVLKVRDEVNCLKSVTGAREDNVGGVIFGKLKN